MRHGFRHQILSSLRTLFLPGWSGNLFQVSIRILTLILDIFIANTISDSQTLRLTKDSWCSGIPPISCVVIFHLSGVCIAEWEMVLTLEIFEKDPDVHLDFVTELQVPHLSNGTTS